MEPVFEKLIKASKELSLRARKSLEDAGMHEAVERDKKLEALSDSFRQKQLSVYEKVGTKELDWELKDWDGCKGKPQVWVHHISKKKTLTLFTWDMERGISGVVSDGRPNGNGYSFFLPGLDMDEAKLVVYAEYKTRA